MLYDSKRWDKHSKTDPVSLDGLIAWLETKPSKQYYPYYDCNGTCLYSQYLEALGFGTGTDAPDSASRIAARKLWDRLHEGSFIYIAKMTPWTFGAALARARKVADELS